MKVHEYQAKELFTSYGVKVPRGKVAQTAEEAKAIAQELGGLTVVKAQIHAGGRGKGGGVKLAKTPEEAFAFAKAMLGMTLVTHQTGPEGRVVHTLLVEEGLPIEKEFYIGMVLDRSQRMPVLMVSPFGGMEIEEVASKHPEALLKIHIDPLMGLQPFQARQVSKFLNLTGDPARNAQKFAMALVKCYLETDASLAEINPLILTKDGRIVALDGKMNFDDNALDRHPNIKAYRDLNEEAPLEVEASKYNLNYIKLDGTVGCMVNGAGLAMATMDIIKLHGAEPANFLDVGGGANLEAVTNAFKILLSDKSVKGVLVNIFGGIVRCDVIAQGVVGAAQQVNLTVPVVVRLEGTNVEAGRKILRESGLKIEQAKGMTDAAQKIVAAVGGR
jgi:succinyl-CoA synthetase beta subunit